MKLSYHVSVLSLFIVFYLLMFKWFYPPMSGIEDEVGFINAARMWDQGHLYLDQNAFKETPLADFFQIDDRWVTSRNPGRSLVIYPLIGTSWHDYLYGTGAGIHVVLTLIFAYLIKSMGISPIYAILVLFHPTLAIYSRTITADALAATFGLLMFVAYYQKRSPMMIGLFGGLAAISRYHGGIYLAVIFLLQWKRRDDWSSLAKTGAVGGGIAVMLFIYNCDVYGHPLGYTSALSAFSWIHLKHQLPFYGISLTLLWPGMLIAPFFVPKELRFDLSLLLGTFTTFFLFYYYHDSRPSWLITTVIGQRLFQVVLPLWILAYVVVADTLLKRFSKVGEKQILGLMMVVGIGLAVANGMVFDRHQRHLQRLEEMQHFLYEKLVPGSTLVGNASFHKLVAIPGPNDPIFRHTVYHYPDDRYDFLDLWKDDKPVYLGLYYRGKKDHEKIIADFGKNYVVEEIIDPFEELMVYRLYPLARANQ